MFEPKPDTAQQIADKIQSAKTQADFHSLILACNARREAIRARSNAIDGATGFEAPARQEAINRGPAALKLLDDELERLNFEFHYLDRLEQLIHVGMEDARLAEIRKQLPAAQRRLNGEIKAALTAIETLIGKIKALQGTFEILGGYSDIGQPFPLDIGEIQSLLELREAIWTLPPPPIMLPPVSGDVRQQVSLLPLGYIWRGGAGTEFAYSIRQRLPPPTPGRQA